MGTDQPKAAPARPRVSRPAQPSPQDAAALVTALGDFAARVGPGVDERREGYHADDDFPTELVRARDAALVAAYRAIERLAALHQGEPACPS
jgi:hypothetical protein